MLPVKTETKNSSNGSCEKEVVYKNGNFTSTQLTKRIATEKIMAYEKQRKKMEETRNVIVKSWPRPTAQASPHSLALPPSVSDEVSESECCIALRRAIISATLLNNPAPTLACRDCCSFRCSVLRNLIPKKRTEYTNQSINSTIHKSINQISQSINESIDKSLNQHNNQSIDLSTDCLINQCVDQPINQ